MSRIPNNLRERAIGMLDAGMSTEHVARHVGCLRIHLRDIISARCFLTVWNISANLSSLIVSLQISENHGFMRIGIVSSAMFFKMEVNKDMGSSTSFMTEWCRRGCIDAEIHPSLPSPTSISEPFQEKMRHRSPK